ncbi:MAG: DUF1553 domain-containing protein [Planctomycetia bacterium]|nr:DUF1553 domain-containing protein [Planctomycetia bacterium]
MLAFTTPTPRLEKMQAEIACMEKTMQGKNAEQEAALARLEAEAIETEKLPTLGPWQSLGPFRAATDREAFETQFGPEKDSRPAEQYGDQRRTAQQYADGQTIKLALPDNSALYLARTITAARAMELNLSLGSDDGLQVWLNGQRLLAHNQTRPAAPDQEKVPLKLQRGENYLLLKIVNGLGPSGFYFAIKPTEIQQILAMPTVSRSAKHRDSLRRYLLTKLPDLAPLRAKIANMQKQEKELRAKSTYETMVMQERPTPRETYVLIRGQFDKKDLKHKLEPLVPACLPPLPAGAPHNRLGLARWLVDPANPLTARVTVNHYWQQFFGIGLVKTTEDFGSQGEPPSHPELLDWLATEFIARHWDVKAMHRLIVTSSTYRQSSRVSPDLLERDMYNRMLARGPRFRLSSFTIRDQALAVAGLLVDKVGGPPVKPYQPDGVWQDFSLGNIKYVQDHGEGLYRRSVYTFWRRSVAPTMLFDTSPRQVCTVKASRTNTPLHALTLLNDVTFVEAARALAQRVMLEGDPAPAARIDRAFRLATARHATPQEMEVLTAGLRRAESQFRNDPAAVKKLLAEGESPRDKKLDEVELAAYTAVMNVILNLDEVLTKE